MRSIAHMIRNHYGVSDSEQRAGATVLVWNAATSTGCPRISPRIITVTDAGQDPGRAGVVEGDYRTATTWPVSRPW